MANLSTLLQNKQTIAQISETNIDQGQIFVMYAGTYQTNFRCEFCWYAPSDGVAHVEVWGAQGSASKMCCCGAGLPGNPGAYSKRTVDITEGQRISGQVGQSCGNSDQICFRGCSESSGVRICAAECTCMCAQGGRAGTSGCVDGTPIYCCFEALGHCVSQVGSAGCGIVCNYGSGYFLPTAYGGSVNCNGEFSCIEFTHCNPACWCFHKQHVRTSANVYSTCPSTIVATADPGATRGGHYVNSFFQGVAGTSASPTNGSFYDYCWAGNRYCGCYEAQGCIYMVPPGIPAPGVTPCSNVRDHGLRGGQGTVKIRFVANPE
tara:strand:- start:4403 stop:5362 length:960 start_codon:yes stop_codon:yes gene_type:complete